MCIVIILIIVELPSFRVFLWKETKENSSLKTSHTSVSHILHRYHSSITLDMFFLLFYFSQRVINYNFKCVCFIVAYQRDTVQSASNFAQRNRLPIRLQEQIFAHLLMKYRTNLEGLQQQEIIDSLPKAIQSSVAHYLFYSLVVKVYLFQGVSNDLLFQLVIFLCLL